MTSRMSYVIEPKIWKYLNKPQSATKKENVKKEKSDTAIKDIRNIFRLEKENEAIKEKTE